MTTFRARARAIDMLGHQQIRGVGTALSELFKNAHDAYATEARVDLFRDRRTLLIRDDGSGMGEIDFVDRWLTLGTESRLREPGAPPPPAPPEGMKPRPMLGEKGIGRLAVAAVGAQVLVLTRTHDSDQTTIAFINWDLFSIPGINLDQVDIPLATLEASAGVGPAELGGLIEAVTTTAKKLPISAARKEQILSEIAVFPLDMVELAAKLEGPKPLEDGGTQFIVFPVDEAVLADLQTDVDGITELQQALIGFANPLDGRPVIAVSFWDRPGPGRARELIGTTQFWTEADLRDADHEVHGNFDEFGTFSGRVRVYDRTRKHRVPRKGPPGLTRVGPFEIHFGYLQGEQVRSRLAPDRYAAMDKKAAAIGGLYVYRDGVRIQPYGDHRFDWLDIERNRSKSASYYFFSYRRIFGYVALTRAANDALSEKAGREGFREDAAYREFRSVLQDLFVELAATFFRTGSSDQYFQTRRDELKRQVLARREHEKATTAARRAFASRLRPLQRKLGRGDSSAS